MQSKEEVSGMISLCYAVMQPRAVLQKEPLRQKEKQNSRLTYHSSLKKLCASKNEWEKNNRLFFGLQLLSSISHRTGNMLLP